ASRPPRGAIAATDLTCMSRSSSASTSAAWRSAFSAVTSLTPGILSGPEDAILAQLYDPPPATSSTARVRTQRPGPPRRRWFSAMSNHLGLERQGVLALATDLVTGPREPALPVHRQERVKLDRQRAEDHDEDQQGKQKDLLGVPREVGPATDAAAEQQPADGQADAERGG